MRSLLLCLACHTSLTAENFPPILPRSQSEGSPASLTRQGSFLSVLCRLAMCYSYSLDYLRCAKGHAFYFCLLFGQRSYHWVEDALVGKVRLWGFTQSSSWVYMYLFKQIILGCLIFIMWHSFDGAWVKIQNVTFISSFFLKTECARLCTAIHSFYSPQLLWSYFLHFLCHSSRAKLPSMKGGRGGYLEQTQNRSTAGICLRLGRLPSIRKYIYSVDFRNYGKARWKKIRVMTVGNKVGGKTQLACLLEFLFLFFSFFFSGMEM